jgi:hypothetical protein
MGHILFSQNLVVNPGFESWDSSTKPTGWTTAQSCQKDDANIESGGFSCRQTGVTGETKSLGQTFTINPGTQYRFSFFYKTEITGTGNGCRIWSKWTDPDNNDINDPITKPILQSTKNYLKSDIWVQCSVDIMSPTNARFFHLEVRTYQNSVAYFDDFVFQENIATSNSEEKFTEIIIYPNPAHNFLNISNIQNLHHIDIQSITGIIVWSSDFSGEQSVTIPVSQLADGIYIIVIRTLNKSIIRRFIRK